MRTKISTFCERIIEAGWLVAVVIVPLFFDVYSSRVFEPDKLSIIRSIATLMAVAWLIKLAEETLPGGEGSGSDASEGSAVGVKDGLTRMVRTPLVVPTVLLAVVYVLASITSVVPRVSFLGSYQRLQGTYSMLTYMVLFALTLQNLRRRDQLERLLNTVIIVSLPIALYGLLQHYQRDPLPWGGDVTMRVAANMGNAIFIGAYLIMVVPLTVARFLRAQNLAIEGTTRSFKVGYGLFFAFAWILLTYAWAAVGFQIGAVMSLLLLAMFALVAAYLKRPLMPFLLSGCYALLLSVQLVCIFFSQSRGPWLGLISGVFFFGLIYIFSRRWRTVATVFVLLAVVGASFLVLINLPNTPFPGVRDIPYVGRLAQIMEIEGGTGKVRVLIWGGTVELLKSDPVRLVIGYGPESMYVAYNPHYPPELAHYEARNASPDRAHNETFDALVTTGLIGYAVYMYLFISIFYYGLHWTGLLSSKAQKWLFGVCIGLGALLGFVLPLIVDHSARFVGVGIPIGLMGGLFVYISVSALRGMGHAPEEGEALEEEGSAPRTLRGWDLLLFVALFSTIVAHFVEIHFGIAIAATRTYFWMYAALLVIVGRQMVAGGALDPVLQDGPLAEAEGRDGGSRRATAARGSRSRRQPRGRATSPSRELSRSAAPSEGRDITAMAVVLAMAFCTMLWNYTTNPLGLTNPFTVLIKAYTTLAAKNQPDAVSFGLLIIFLLTWLAGAVVSVAESAHPNGREETMARTRRLLRQVARFMLISAGIALLYAVIHAAQLGPSVDLPNMIYEFFVVVFLVWVALAIVLRGRRATSTAVPKPLPLVGYGVLLVVALLIINQTNILIVKADIMYKQGFKYDQGGEWDKAVYFYQRAVEEMPKEDFYHLFRGRALMELAKQQTDADLRKNLYGKALESLTIARDLNPMNTDHTANMGRLHRTWAEDETDPVAKAKRLEMSIQRYEQAAALSPNNAQIRDEWGLAYYLAGDVEKAEEKYREALVLDNQFMQTYYLLGELAFDQQDWETSIEVYEQALEINPGFLQGWSALAYAYSQAGRWEDAIEANLVVAEAAPQDYGTLKNLAILYNQQQMPEEALPYAERALAVAPEGDQPTIEQFIQQLRQQIGG